MKNIVLKNQQLKIHPMLDETFSFADKKKKIIGVQSNFSSEQIKAILFCNLLMVKRNRIYPIYKAYYNDYKKVLSSLPSSYRDNMFDFLRIILQKDRYGKMVYLEKLYNRKDIIPDTFLTLYDLFKETDSVLASSISNFLKAKEQEEIESFNKVSQFVNQVNGKFYRNKPPFLLASDEEIKMVLQDASFQNGNYYTQILQKKSLSPKLREAFFQFLYTMRIPFSSADLKFFLSFSHLESKRLTSLLQAFSISRSQFDTVFAMSVCEDPTLIDFYHTFLTEKEKTEEEVSLYPTIAQIKEEEEKLAICFSKRKVLQ